MTTDQGKRPAATTTAKQTHETANIRAAIPKGTASPNGDQAGVRAATPATPATPRGAVPVQAREAPAAKKPLTYEKRMRSLAPIVQVRRKIASTMKRFTNLAEQVRAWKNAPDLREAASKVETALTGMLAEATTTPDTFEPERERKAPGGQLETGAKVGLREKFVARYAAVLEPGEGSNLQVVATTRSHVSVSTQTGVRIVLPRAHVTKAIDAA